MPTRNESVKPSFEEAKKWAKKLSDLLESGSSENMSLSTYWKFINIHWENLKKAMGE